jgi:hypothetical protein
MGRRFGGRTVVLKTNVMSFVKPSPGCQRRRAAVR